MATEERVYYSFTVKGTFENGNKATVSGTVVDAPDYPTSAFDKAVAACKRLTPDILVDMSKGGNVVLRQLKRKPALT